MSVSFPQSPQDTSLSSYWVCKQFASRKTKMLLMSMTNGQNYKPSRNGRHAILKRPPRYSEATASE